MTPATAHTTHLSAESAREHEADFVKALAQADEAFAQYITENNPYGASEALCSRVLTLRHCARQTPSSSPFQSEAYLTQALHTAQASIALAQKASVSCAIQYHNLGKVQADLGLLEDAIASYEKAVSEQESHPHETQNRPGVLANMHEMLASAQLASGDLSALTRAEKALADLEASDEDAYNKAVWLLHGHSRIAHACQASDRASAQRHYTIARDMLASRQDLKLSTHILDDLEGLATE